MRAEGWFSFDGKNTNSIPKTALLPPLIGAEAFGLMITPGIGAPAK